eukprot:scaffold79109_cov47-Attheya_sp.AAC.2
MIYVLTVSVLAVLEPFLILSCTAGDGDGDGDGDSEKKVFKNVLYVDDPCQTTRLPQLLFLTAQECSFGRRLVISVVLGGIIGWERREADRPAGIRTMALVSLGSCLFAICSAFAFLDGPMSWDSSRVAAAIPSGVGFLGAGLIFKQESRDEESGENTHSVHGLTTAASLWLCAAVGIACGGQMYFAATFCVALMLVLLRFGPRHVSDDDDDDDDEESNSNKGDEFKDGENGHLPDNIGSIHYYGATHPSDHQLDQQHIELNEYQGRISKRMPTSLSSRQRLRSKPQLV